MERSPGRTGGFDLGGEEVAQLCSEVRSDVRWLLKDDGPHDNISPLDTAVWSLFHTPHSRLEASVTDKSRHAHPLVNSFIFFKPSTRHCRIATAYTIELPNEVFVVTGNSTCAVVVSELVHRDVILIDIELA